MRNFKNVLVKTNYVQYFAKIIFFLKSRMTDTNQNENPDSTPDRLENENQTLKVIMQCENVKNLLPCLFLTENYVKSKDFV